MSHELLYKNVGRARHFAITVTSHISLTRICTIISVSFNCLMLNLDMFKYGQKDPQKQSFLIPDLDGLVL